MRQLVLVPLLVALAASAAHAQDPPARYTFDLVAGAVFFDLNGTGADVGGAARLTRPLTGTLGLNVGVLVARPNEDSGRSTLVVPEAHLHYHWRAGAVRPYAGGGIGWALLFGGGDSRSNLSLAAAAGARVELPGQVAIIGEFRLRGIERDFAGTTAEWMGGVSWFLD
jgi:hypothetical protein